MLGDYRIMEQNTGVQQLRPNLKSNEIERIDRESMIYRTGQGGVAVSLRERTRCVSSSRHSHR